MGFLSAMLRAVLYTIVLVLLLVGSGVLYVWFFQGSTEPVESSWASYQIDSTGFTFSKVITNKIKLNVITAGPETGKTVVMLHGFPESALISWHYHIAYFAKLGYRVIAPDQRGYNTSDKPEGKAAYIYDELAKDVIGLLDHYEQEKVILVGHDWGAAVAFRVAMMFPERIEKLAILNVPHPLTMESYLKSSFQQLSKSWYIFFFQLPAIPELKFQRENYQFGRSAIANSGIRGKSFSADARDRLIQSWSEPGCLTGMLNWYRAALQMKSRNSPVDPMIKPKTLIIWGKNDTALSYELAELSLREYVKDGRLVALDATHWVQHDLPEEVATHLETFFAESS